MKIVKRVLVVGLCLLLSLVFAYNIYRFVCIRILKKDMATIAGYTALEVVSGSMEPTLHIGDMIIINTKEKTYKKGDIVTFYDKEGSFVTHRIISINEVEMVTKGDNNNKEDQPTNVENIVGKYVFKVSRGQKLLSALKSPLIAVLILINGIFLGIYVSIDKQGNLILDDEEKEYEEFRQYLNKKKKK